MRKIIVSGLVATAALLGCAGPALAGTGTASAAGPATTAAAGPATAGKTAGIASLRAIAARYPAKSAGARAIGSYIERLSVARPQASGDGSVSDILGETSCASPTACLSVGARIVTNSSGTSDTITPTAARLHAGTWKSVPVKTPKGAEFTLLTGVSCKAATYCLVSGETFAKSATGGISAYLLTWDGTTLTPIAAPPMPAHSMGVVTAVSCVAVKSCVAVGIGGTETATTATRIIWTWNGTAWARTTAPPTDPNTVTEFTGLRCFSLTSCVLIGVSDDLTSENGSETPVAARWNGTTFTDLKAPLPAGSSDATFEGFSCVSTRSCAVVGEAYRDSTDASSFGFAEVWNGTTWTVTKWRGPAGDTDAALLGVSCTSAVRCIAVGVHGSDTTAAPAALALGGSKWTVLKVPGAGNGKEAAFESVNCPVNGQCVATGASAKTSGASPAVTPIAGYWNGRAWKYGPMFPAAAA